MFKQRVYVCLFTVVFILACSALSHADGFTDPVGDWFRFKSRGFNSSSHKGVDITGFSGAPPFSIDR